MTGKLIRRFRVYPAWDYQQEITDLNRASEQGLQLVHAGLFLSKFERKSGVRYRYQADYRRLNGTEMHRYLGLFEEQGWEHVNSTFNGWHVFRKRYDPALPESAYEIYTDTASMREMQRRWTLGAAVAVALLSLFAVNYTVALTLRPQLPNLLRASSWWLLIGFLLYGILRMKRTASRKGRSRDGVLFLVILPVFAAVSLWLAPHFERMRPNFNSNSSTESVSAPSQVAVWADVSVGYSDFYYLDLDIDAKAPLTFTLKDEAGETVYTVTDTKFTADRIRFRLEPGSYQIELGYSDGFKLHCALR